MRPQHSNSGTGRGQGAWLVLLVLLAAVLVPTGCVLWFMNAAMKNERLAVRQRLADVYGEQLRATQARLEEYWAGKLQALDAAGKLPFDKLRVVSKAEPPAGQAFKSLVESHQADSVLVYDPSGKLTYPVIAGPLTPTAPELWGQAHNLEWGEHKLQAAADAYAAIAKDAKEPNIQAQAFLSQARCLVAAGKPSEALAILNRTLRRDEFQAARDSSGRLIAPDAMLRSLQLMSPGSKEWSAAAKYLAGRLSDYEGPPMPSSQRLFLMKELAAAANIEIPLIDAEELAAQYVDSAGARSGGVGLLPAGQEGLWTFPSSDGRLVALFRKSSVAGAMESCRPGEPLLAGAEMSFVYGPRAVDSGEPFLSLPAGKYMPDWRMTLRLAGPDPFSVAAARQNAVYLWAGGLGIASIALLAAAMAAYVGRQIKLTRLKNDLIATVSHELKTPLASMRVLVDTMLEGRCRDDKQADEYLRLVAHENERLSRLIDNFLTFSRMERNKRTFEFAPVEVGEVVGAAVESVQERFSPPAARLVVQVAPGLPSISADRDAMVTVLLNLLDNAWKYSGDEKHVCLRAFRTDGEVCLEVSDNGIGMTRRAMRRIFDKFYQVDQTLSRRAGGCGLGLSIVKFILDAHGGTIRVASQAGKGSVFTVRLPAGRQLAAAPRIKEDVHGR